MHNNFHIQDLMGIKKCRFKKAIIANFLKNLPRYYHSQNSPPFYAAKQNLYTTNYNFSIRRKEKYSVNRGKTCANI